MSIDPNKVFVGNVHFDTTEEELEGHFADVGEVVSVSIPKDRETGRGRGFAFVEFENEAQADRALDVMNGTILRERDLRISRANNRESAPGEPKKRAG